jgi:small GTP-binding protein
MSITILQMGNTNDKPKRDLPRRVLRQRPAKNAYSTIVIGDAKVGKSCLIKRAVEDKFNDAYSPTVGIDLDRYEDNGMKITMWDTSGDERFKTITISYYRNTSGIVLCYDITNRESFNNIGKWLKNVEENHPNPDTVAYILVGTKSDLEKERQVTYDEGLKVAVSRDIPFIEISAKTNKNITKCMDTIIQTLKTKTSTETYYEVEK